MTERTPVPIELRLRKPYALMILVAWVYDPSLGIMQ